MELSKEKLAEAFARLKEERDELRVRMHLGTMEVKQEGRSSRRSGTTSSRGWAR